jgi:hypothetical protein
MAGARVQCSGMAMGASLSSPMPPCFTAGKEDRKPVGFSSGNAKQNAQFCLNVLGWLSR